MVRSGFRRWVVFGLLVFVAACFESAYAQAPAGRGAAPQQPRIYANMVQLMRGTLYPQSNVIFTAQVEDPASFKPAAHQSTSSDPFTSAYGGWEHDWKESIINAVVLTAMTVGIFYYGLGLPFRLWPWSY